MGRPLSKYIFANDLLQIHPYTGGTKIITKQKGSRRYECENNGVTVFRLVTTTDLDPGQAYMLAYDTDGNVYYVEKLVRHLATLIHKELGQNQTSYQFANGQAVKWVTGGEVQGVSVRIQNDL